MSELEHLQRQVGNSVVVATLSAPGAAGRTMDKAMGQRPPTIQRWREMSPLYKAGWKFSGGGMATNSNVDPLWHASVFSVDNTGKSTGGGPFFDGFHLTMEYYAGSEKTAPHVFFSAAGAYDAGATLAHPQTKKYIAAVGGKQWAFDLQTAQDLAKKVPATLGPILNEEQRKAIVEAARAEKERVKEEGEVAAAEEAAKKKLEAEAAAAAQDEETSVKEFLKDVKFLGGTYFQQFMAYIGGKKDAINDKKLATAADWYLGGRDMGKWTIKEPPKAAYTGWDKTPATVEWDPYANCTATVWRAKNPETTFMSEYRMLRFHGYASYKLHPLARKAPKL